MDGGAFFRGRGEGVFFSLLFMGKFNVMPESREQIVMTAVVKSPNFEMLMLIFFLFCRDVSVDSLKSAI